MSPYLTERYLRLADGTLPHMGVKGDGDVAPYVLISGSASRVLLMKEHLSAVRQYGSDRGALVFTGEYQNTPVTVASTGMGCPSLAMSVEELAVAGGQFFIRTGSCASISPDVKIGDLIIATAGVRDEGTSPYYAPEIYPAVADFYVVDALRKAVSGLDEQYHLGLVRSTDSFYEGERNEKVIDTWRIRNVVAFEMESSALFTIGSVLGFSSGSILVPGSNLVTARSTYQGHDVEQYKQGVELMINAALDALVILSKTTKSLLNQASLKSRTLVR